jgi:hypothetical protein
LGLPRLSREGWLHAADDRRIQYNIGRGRIYRRERCECFLLTSYEIAKRNPHQFLGNFAGSSLCWRDRQSFVRRRRGHGNALDTYSEKCRSFWSEQSKLAIFFELHLSSLPPPILSLFASALNQQEYLYKVCDSVRQLCPQSEDQYLSQLEKLVRKKDPEHSNRPPPGL